MQLSVDEYSSVRGWEERCNHFFFFSDFLETRNFDMFIRLFAYYLFSSFLVIEREKKWEGEGRGWVYLRKNHVNLDSILTRSTRLKSNEKLWGYFDGTKYFLRNFFRILKFFFLFPSSQKYFIFFRYLIPSFFAEKFPARYFRWEREARRNVKWINLKWWSVLKAPFNWLLASPNDVGGRKGRGQVLHRIIGCVEQLNDGLMVFRYYLLLTLYNYANYIE